jgi:hypothetical protein
MTVRNVTTGIPNKNLGFGVPSAQQDMLAQSNSNVIKMLFITDSPFLSALYDNNFR